MGYAWPGRSLWVGARGAGHVHSRGPRGQGRERGLRFLLLLLPLLPVTSHHFWSLDGSPGPS